MDYYWVVIAFIWLIGFIIVIKSKTEDKIMKAMACISAFCCITTCLLLSMK